jgi:hypothetical protein
MNLTNEIQAVIEDRAEDELYAASSEFAEWLADQQPAELASIVSCAARLGFMGASGERARSGLHESAGRLMHDYKEWRVVQAQKSGEWEEVRANLLEQARDQINEERESARAA